MAGQMKLVEVGDKRTVVITPMAISRPFAMCSPMGSAFFPKGALRAAKDGCPSSRALKGNVDLGLEATLME